MRRILIFRLGSRELHLPKLFGAFLMIATFLMVVQSITAMFDSWEAVKSVHACIDAANSGNALIQDCQTQAYYAFDILLRANQYRLTDMQIITGLIPKIAGLFFWVAAFIIGMVFYRSWKIVLPIEESVINLKSSPRWKGRRK